MAISVKLLLVPMTLIDHRKKKKSQILLQYRNKNDDILVFFRLKIPIMALNV